MSRDPKEAGTIGQTGAGGNGENPDPPQTLPPALRLLRVLVTVLTAVMIVGMVALVALFFLRFPAGGDADLPPLPARIALPEGAVPQAVTTGPGWLGVVTQDGRILFFDADTGALRREVQVEMLP